MIAFYIDPGTGSMLLSLLFGLASACTFGLHALSVKLHFLWGRGRSVAQTGPSLPYVIFSDHKRYWNVFEGICQELDRRNIDFVYYTMSSDDPAFDSQLSHMKVEFIGTGNKAFARLNNLCADIVISTTPNLDVYGWKRSKGVKWYVHIPHSADELAGYRMFGLDYYDAVLTSGENQVSLIRTIENLRPAIQRKEIVTVGSLPLDHLKAIHDLHGRQTHAKPVVLLAPSWGKSGILSRYGEKLLCALKDTGFDVVVRPHPQSMVSEKEIVQPLIDKFPEFTWDFSNENFEALDKADILITDFSGIIFDFSMVFDKPLIYADTHFNTIVYDADWLSEPRWSFQVLPLIGLPLKEEDFPHLGDVIRQALESTSLQEGRNRVRRQCWGHVGESARLAVDYLVEKQKALLGEHHA